MVGFPYLLVYILEPSALTDCIQLAVSLVRHPVVGSLPVIQGRARKGSEGEQACGWFHVYFGWKIYMERSKR